MGESGALLEALQRLLTPGSTENILAWVFAAILAALAAGYALHRRASAKHDEVEYLFLATTTASRKAREIGEIDRFARTINASAEELKTQVRRMRASHYSQVKIYIDHSNFIRAWTENVHSRERPLEHDVDWSVLPHLLLQETAAWLAKARKAPQALIYRGTNVYGTLFQDDYFRLLESMLRLEESAPDRLPLPIRLRRETIDRWREENEAHKTELTRTIQSQPGYLIIPIYRRTPREESLMSANFTSGGIPIAPEKMLDTHIATDLIGDASFDVYDIALLISEDSDFIPVVEFVQEMRYKQVVHVGFGSQTTTHGRDLRSRCRYHIDLTRGQLYKRMQRPAKGA
jgi:uncharacterized LabA/DUF88 family protein